MSKKILIIDDDRVSRSLTQKALQAEDYAITSVEDGPKGVTAYLNSLASAPFDLIVLDIGMKGMDGLRVLKMIRQEEASRGIPGAKVRSVPVIMLTASVEHRQKAFETGCSDYMVKPVAAGMLLTKIRERLLQESSPQDGRQGQTP